MKQFPEWLQGVHHDGSSYFVSNPSPTLGETVTLTLRVPRRASVERVYVRAMLDGEFKMIAMRCDETLDHVEYWRAELTVSQPRIDYRFKMMSPDGAFYVTAQGLRRADSPDFESFVLLADYDGPLWVREEVFYQIFPERFHNGDESNDPVDGENTREGHSTIKREWGEEPYPWSQHGSMDFFGGDLAGITQKLDYITDLGVTALYLTPIFHAESNHKYDIIDFKRVDPHFGGDAALAELREATRQHGLKLMLDITPNHVSYHHPWVAGAIDGDETLQELFYVGAGGGFEQWLGVRSLIKLNYQSETLRNWMYRDEDSALQHWLRPPYRADAWRLDVANMTGNKGESQLDHEVWREMRTTLRESFPDVYLLGEYFQDGTPHLQGDELDASMNYQGFSIPVRRWLGAEDLAGHDNQPYSDTVPMPAWAMVEQWQRFIGAIPYPIALQQFNLLDSHDTTRILEILKGDTDALKLALALLMAFPGVPCIYYGTEIGMTGGRDPHNRRCMPWDESAWDTDLRAATQRLIAIRKETPALQHGSFDVLPIPEGISDDEVVIFARQHEGETVLFIGTRSAMAEPLSIDLRSLGVVTGTFTDLLTGDTFEATDAQLTIPPLAVGAPRLLRRSAG